MSALSLAQTLDCLRSDDLLGLGMEADAVRRRLHPAGVATYANLRTLPFAAEMEPQLAESLDLGASGVLLTGCRLGLEALVAFLAATRRRFPTLSLAALLPEELAALGEASMVLPRLRDAGLSTILPGGLDLRHDPAPWLAVHRAAHRAGLPTSAVLPVGAGESLEQRAATLHAIAALQGETGGFVSVSPRTFHPGRRALDDATAVESLTMLAVTRLVLDAVPHIETDWASEGLKVLNLSLRFGADDLGSVVPPVHSAEGEALATEEDLRRVIREAGLQPAERDLLFRTTFLP